MPLPSIRLAAVLSSLALCACGGQPHAIDAQVAPPDQSAEISVRF